jgi:ElaB/YqjD/DUF883 family membrane-anchored ribosome-binding protein
MNEVRSPEQIERQISDIRAQIGHTLDAVQEKISPGELLDQALVYAKGGGEMLAASLGRGIRKNPAPAALIGVGIGWLVYVSLRPSSPSSERPISGGDAAGGYEWADDAALGGEAVDSDQYVYDTVPTAESQSKLETVRERASELVERGRDLLNRAGDAGQGLSARASDLTERASQLTGSAMDRLRTTRDTAREGLMRTRSEAMHARETTVEFVKNNPLAVTAAALVAGAVIGALLPRTRREDSLMGEHRDKLVDEVKSAATEQADQLVGEIGDRTDTAFDAAEETLKDAGTRDDRVRGNGEDI